MISHWTEKKTNLPVIFRLRMQRSQCRHGDAPQEGDMSTPPVKRAWAGRHLHVEDVRASPETHWLHRHVAECHSRKEGKAGLVRCKRGNQVEVGSGSEKRQKNYMCMSNGRMRLSAGTWYLCVSLFALRLRCARLDYRALLTKNMLTPKGLITQSGALKRSNLFIWWFLMCCFSASFHCAELFSIHGACRKINVENTAWLGGDWKLVVGDEKGHYESNQAWFFFLPFLDKMEDHERSQSSCIEKDYFECKNEMHSPKTFSSANVLPIGTSRMQGNKSRRARPRAVLLIASHTCACTRTLSLRRTLSCTY